MERRDRYAGEVPKLSPRGWVAVGSSTAAIALIAVLAALQNQPPTEVLGAEYEQTTTSSSVATTSTIADQPSTTVPTTAAPTPPPTARSTPAASPPPATTGVVAGTVTVDGQPSEGAKVTIFLAGGGEISSSTDGAGRYQLDAVAPGQHRLEVVTGGNVGCPSSGDSGDCVGSPSQTANRTVDVAAGRKTTADVAFS